MKIKPRSRKLANHGYAWLPLVIGIASIPTDCVWSADDSILSIEPDSSTNMILSTPELGIPADNPIGAVLLSKRHPLLRYPDFSRVSESLKQIYQNSNYQPVWLTPNRSEKNLHDLIGILSDAAANGLNSTLYEADRIRDWITSPNTDGNFLYSYDVALTISFVRYLNDLREGQMNPRDVQSSAHLAAKPPLDIGDLLKQHIDSQTLTEMVRVYEPKNKQYQRLKIILNNLQQLAHLTETDAFKPGSVLRPGDRHPQIVLLRQYLKAMGISADTGDIDDPVYDSELVSAVKKLQTQSGLKADGVVGPATTKLFNQSPVERIARIELAMERARWIPDDIDGPMILVNIPAFELWAFSSVDDPNPLNMKVIVGKAPENQTPLLWEEMKYLEFMPYWNIPKSIFQKEILPKTRNNKGYLASHDIELVRHKLSEEKGGVTYIRARQRPGKKNPLGRVKFVFPNTADVYMHDTPGKAAFSRQRRDLSHGCVRVSEPERLAEFVLGDQKEWDKETITQAMSASKTRHVTLKRAIPVLFYYGTTFVDPENRLRFYPDIYGLDEQMRTILKNNETMTTVAVDSGKQLLANGDSVTQ
ncbi:L,D-transpeptidase family protein [Methylomonas sp. MgM2]